MVEIQPRHNVASVRKRWYPASINENGIPADVVAVQMSMNDVSDLVGGGAGGLQPRQYQAIELIYSRRSARLVVADTSIDDNDIRSCMYDPELDGHNEPVHLWNPMMGRHPGLVLRQNGLRQIGKEKGWIMGRRRIFQHSGDTNIANYTRLNYHTLGSLLSNRCLPTAKVAIANLDQ